ncbi:MAG: hypothetical protein ABI037_12075 [Gemmatimonadales bacterium]
MRSFLYPPAFLIGSVILSCTSDETPTAPGADKPAQPEVTQVAGVSMKDVLRVQDLGTLGGAQAGADDINERGQVTGGAATLLEPSGHVYRWSRERGMRDLGTLGGGISGGVGLNDRGDVTGVSRTANEADHAFLWTERHGMQDLGTLGGPDSYGSAVNNRHQVAGDSPLSAGDGGRRRPFLWTAAGGMRNLGTLGGPGSDVWGTDINDHSQVVGILFPDGLEGESPTRAYRWTPERGMQDLGTLGGRSAQAWSINERGEITGGSSDADGLFQAFLWSPRRGMQPLGAFAGGVAVGYSVNRHQVVVGESADQDFRFLPFVWTKRTGMRALPIAEVGGVEGAARGVDDKNEISGYIITADGLSRAVLWQPRRDRDLLTATITETVGEFEVAAVGAPSAAPRGKDADGCRHGRQFALRVAPTNAGASSPACLGR